MTTGIDADLFATAQLEIYNLMFTDPFTRYSYTNKYAEWLSEFENNAVEDIEK